MEVLTSPRRSFVRWNILGLMVVVSMITYLDRLNIAIAAPQIMAEYHLTSTDMGRIFSAFILAYGLFQLPGGWLADRFGPRGVLSAALLWWSVFTALSAMILNVLPVTLFPVVVTLGVTRFCLGMGEAAAWPGFNRAIANWIPARERALAASLPLAGGGLGAALTPPLIASLMVAYGWRNPFYVSAAVGVLFAGVWFFYVRNRPTEHPGVSPAELSLIESGQEKSDAPSGVDRLVTPWKQILFEPNVWLLFVTNFCAGYAIYIYLTWFYTYLVEFRHLSFVKGSVYTMGPFVAITIMTPLGGTLCDRAAKRYGITASRRMIAMGGMSFAAIALYSGARLPGINLSVFAFSLGAGAIFFAFSAHWATTIDITKPFAGTVAGIMNWGGNTGGMISPILTPYLAKKFGWIPAIEFAASILLAGSLIWFLIQPEKSLLTEQGESGLRRVA
jgi:ACS family glucarate transporter-like MFS transporter